MPIDRAVLTAIQTINQTRRYPAGVDYNSLNQFIDECFNVTTIDALHGFFNDNSDIIQVLVPVDTDQNYEFNDDNLAQFHADLLFEQRRLPRAPLHPAARAFFNNEPAPPPYNPNLQPQPNYHENEQGIPVGRPVVPAANGNVPRGIPVVHHRNQDAAPLPGIQHQRQDEDNPRENYHFRIRLAAYWHGLAPASKKGCLLIAVALLTCIVGASLLPSLLGAVLIGAGVILGLVGLGMFAVKDPRVQPAPINHERQNNMPVFV